MRLAIVGAGLLLAGAIAIASGVLPVADAVAVGARVWPVLLFAVAVTVVAELADRAGVFAAVAERLARLGRGHGLPVWIPATVAAMVLLAAFAVRDRAFVRPRLVPWGLLLFASGLFLVVEGAHALGLASALAALTGTGDDATALLRMSASGFVGANAINNLPAYLALEPLADSPLRIAALLIGVNAGPLVTPWASLAVLLWHDRLRALGVELSWGRYILLGSVAAPATVLLATLALVATA